MYTVRTKNGAERDTLTPVDLCICARDNSVELDRNRSPPAAWNGEITHKSTLLVLGRLGHRTVRIQWSANVSRIGPIPRVVCAPTSFPHLSDGSALRDPQIAFDDIAAILHQRHPRV
jgi:hypothetical protein